MGLLEILSIGAFHPWTSLFLAFTVYILLLYAYRLFLHPLASFPGPYLAALTNLYEFYYDFCSPPGGQYMFVIRDMHAKYGPIIRISPDELHVNDPSFLPELMPAGGRRRDRYARHKRLFGATQATGATLNHDLHRVRRGAMSKTFSKESIRGFDHIMKGKMKKLFESLMRFQESREPVNLLPMFAAFTSDLVSEIMYGMKPNWLEAPDFNQPFFDMVHGLHKFGPLAIQFGWFIPLITAIPRWFSSKVDPGLSIFVNWKKEVLSQIDSTIQDSKEGKQTRTIFDEIMASNLSDADKERERLLDEARMITIAGTEPLTWTLSPKILTFHLLSNPAILSKLRAELKQALPDVNALPSIKDMEQLPYLSAVISEGLRISMGLSRRQVRISPDEKMLFHDGDREWDIPAGTPVGISAPLIHLDPTLFPNPLTFSPERFIADPRLRRSLLNFSRGSRQCLGMHFAYAQLYVLVPGIWRRFGGSEEEKGEEGWWELFETDKTDVEMVADRFVPYPKADSKGIRIIIRK